MVHNFLPFLVITFFFLSLFAYVKLAGPIPFSVNSTTTSKSDTFNVTGEGKATVKPDIATITVGIQANGASAKEVQNQINTNINKVSDAIKKLGIDPKDIKTQNYSINPTFNYNSGDNQKITGYSGSTNILIKVRNLDNANNVLDTAIAQGANQIGNISFDVEDKTRAEAEARIMAVAQAKKKAQDAAKIAGFSLGKIINYSENQGGPPGPLPMMKADSGQGLGGGGTQVEPGSNEIDLTVTLSYEVN